MIRSAWANFLQHFWHLKCQNVMCLLLILAFKMPKNKAFKPPKKSILNAKIWVFKMLKLAFNFYEMDPWTLDSFLYQLLPSSWVSSPLNLLTKGDCLSRLQDSQPCQYTTLYTTPCTDPCTPINPDTNPTPPNLQALGLHDTAAALQVFVTYSPTLIVERFGE